MSPVVDVYDVETFCANVGRQATLVASVHVMTPHTAEFFCEECGNLWTDSWPWPESSDIHVTRREDVTT